MEWFVKAFLKASLVWLSLGVTLGVAMAVHPAWTVYRPAHLHMTLLGFVTGMIYGVAYHVIPRFSGNPLRSARLAGMHWWSSNVGLALMVGGFAARASGSLAVGTSTAVLGVGGTLAALGAYVFSYNIWRTITGPSVARLMQQPSMGRSARPGAVQRPVVAAAPTVRYHRD